MRLTFILFCIGILVSITGWFIDKAVNFPFVMKIIAPEYVSLKKAFDILDTDQKSVISLNDPAAKILLKWWTPAVPAEVLKEAKTMGVVSIGRSNMALSIATGKSFYELRLAKKNNEYLQDYVWPHGSEAKERINSLLESNIITHSMTIFFVGILISVLSFIFEYAKK